MEKEVGRRLVYGPCDNIGTRRKWHFEQFKSREDRKQMIKISTWSSIFKIFGGRNGSYSKQAQILYTSINICSTLVLAVEMQESGIAYVISTGSLLFVSRIVSSNLRSKHILYRKPLLSTRTLSEKRETVVAV